jgi:AbrB family looped-hinge helix DNA binding protein
MITSQITSKGQTTIPRAVREALGLKTHDRLVYEVKKGQTVIHPMRGTIFDHRNSVQPKRRPEDFGSVRAKVKGKVAKRAVERSEA